MASSSKKWANIISRIASRIYFLLIILQVPLFRFPCRIGTCTTPVEVTSSQLIANQILPEAMVKALLFPGAIARTILYETAIPSYDHLLKVYNFTHWNRGPASSDLKFLEFFAGCYLSVAGAFLGLIRSGRLSGSGVLLIVWGLGKEMFFMKHAKKDSGKAVCIYSTMWIAVVLAFLSIRGDVRKLLRSCRLKNIVPPFTKAKLS